VLRVPDRYSDVKAADVDDDVSSVSTPAAHTGCAALNVVLDYYRRVLGQQDGPLSPQDCPSSILPPADPASPTAHVVTRCSSDDAAPSDPAGSASSSSDGSPDSPATAAGADANADANAGADVDGDVDVPLPDFLEDRSTYTPLVLPCAAAACMDFFSRLYAGGRRMLCLVSDKVARPLLLDAG